MQSCRRHRLPGLSALLATLLLAACASPPMPAASTAPHIVVSANEGKVRLVDGTVEVVPGGSDSLAVIDIGRYPPRTIAEIPVPATVQGPPSTVAVSPDGAIALVSAGQRFDPADPKKLVPADQVSVVDLRSTPPRVSGSVKVGRLPAGLSFTPDGRLALVVNRVDATVSVLRVEGSNVREIDRVKVGPDNSSPAHVAVSPDGRWAVVVRQEDHTMSMLSIDGEKVALARRDFSAGLRPYGLAIHPSGRFGAVANIGRGGGDADTVSVIDFTGAPARVVDTITVGQTPEGLAYSPDGAWLAVVTMEGSNKPAASPFFNANGRVTVFAVEGASLRRVAEAKVGRWSQGVAFSRDNRTVVVQNMVEKNLTELAFDGRTLRDDGHRVALQGGAAAIAAGR